MSAVISACQKYRYELVRDGLTKAPTHRTMLFIMLNPSTADWSADDATIRRCKAFAKRERCDRLKVVNLYAYRSTDPKELFKVDDPIGPSNDVLVSIAVKHADVIVCGWGSHGTADRERAVGSIIRRTGASDRCFALGLTKSGRPRHPLYVRSDAPLIKYEVTV